MRLSGYVNGERTCASCEHRHRRSVPNGKCRECGKADYLVRGLCSAHYKRLQVDSRAQGTCVGCRERKTLDSHRRCSRCAKRESLRDRLDARLTRLWGPLERRSSAARALTEHLAAHRSIDRVLHWLDAMHASVRAALRDLGSGRVPSWGALQRLRRMHGGEQLAATCLRARLVEAPSAEVDRIDRQLQAMHARAPAAALVVRQYWQFYLRERVELRRARKLVDRTLESDRAALNIAFEFLQFIDEGRKRSLATLRAADVDAWMRQAPRSHVPRLRPFLAWSFRAGLVKHRFTLPSAGISPATALSDASYHAIQRRALTVASVPLAVRVAVLLVARCARYPREIVELRLTDLRRVNGTIWIRFTHGMQQPIDGADAQLVATLAAQQRRKGTPWLFPSKPRPEAHVTAHGLCQNIDAAGFTANLNHLRNAACRDLLKDFTPTELCEILGMGLHVADHWQRRGYPLTRSERSYVNQRSRAVAGAGA